MSIPRILHYLVAGTLAVSTPATAALTARDVAPEENPRTVWLERHQDSRQASEQVERVSQTYKVGGDGAIDLQNISGSVRVIVGRGNEILLEAVKRVRHRDPEEARRVMQQLRIDVTQLGGRVQVRTIYPRTNTRGLSAGVEYTVSVPATAVVAVKTISGNVSVTGVRGEVRAETTSGDVSVSGTPNLALAKTVSGNVIARDIGAPASLTLGTISGSVIASGLKVRTLDAGTVSGNLQLSDMTVERLQAKAISGDIEYSGGLARGGHYDFNSHSGNVRLMLTGSPGFEIDAGTFSGSIRSDFPITLRSTQANNRGGTRSSNRSIRGTHGDAGAILAVRSFSGSVVITKK